MCTAISVSLKNHYFGRNLDYEHTFGEKITITPRNYGFTFTNGEKLKKHYALIGVALPYCGYPLYFDAVNEKGLSMAGLRFAGYAEYKSKSNSLNNIASFELISWVLSKCKSVFEAKILLEKVNITNEAFDETLPPTPLHWIVADKKTSIVVEQTKDGLYVYDNPVGVLTNNPTFDMHTFNLVNFLSVSPYEPRNNFSDKIDLKPYSRGMGAMGLPGDLSSMSRFVKASFTKLNSVYGDTEEEIVHHFFHILYSVYQQKGCVRVGDGFEITNYTSCCNTDKGIYYYTTYNNSSIMAVDIYKEDLDSSDLKVYDMQRNGNITFQN